MWMDHENGYKGIQIDSIKRRREKCSVFLTIESWCLDVCVQHYKPHGFTLVVILRFRGDGGSRRAICEGTLSIFHVISFLSIDFQPESANSKVLPSMEQP